MKNKELTMFISSTLASKKMKVNFEN